MSSVITPSLSSIEQNAYKMGEKSIDTLLHEIDSKQKGVPIDHKKIIIDTELIIRNSC
jgi:LacI family transcriptional regulator